MSKPDKITAERARELLRYEPDTGKLFWKESRPGVRGGSKAGSIRNCNGSKYIAVGLDRASYYAHRVIFLMMEDEFPDHQVDHINGDGLDNRWHNLRHASKEDNGQNRKRNANNKSGCTGVFWSKENDKWRAEITASGKTYYIGLFNSFDRAAAARKAAEHKYGFHENHDREE